MQPLTLTRRRGVICPAKTGRGHDRTGHGQGVSDGVRPNPDRCPATGRRLTRDELEALRAQGERAAEAGVGLRHLVRAHLSAAQDVRAELPRGAAADHLLTAVEQAVDAFAEGHERAQQLAIRQQDAARREFIDDLLHGRSDASRLAERAERFGLLLSHAHAVAMAQGPEPYDDGYPVTRSVESSLTARFGNRRILLTTKNGRLICIAPGDQADVLGFFAKQAYAATDGGRVAIRRPHPGVGGVVHSYEEALNALDLAARMHLEAPVLHSADLLVYPVLTATGRPWPTSCARCSARSNRLAAARSRSSTPSPRTSIPAVCPPKRPGGSL
ncbi:hypothetical protein GCM10010271_72720 [Streptomyces kurssanovii]|nr:hypothetical protein GCM10010271_72720 [Streptomyces kurssanovii]